MEGREIVILSRPAFCLLLALMLVVGVSISAQRVEGVLSLEDGDRERPLASVVDGRWIPEENCLPGDSRAIPSASGPLRASGEIRLSTPSAIRQGSQEWLRLAPTILELFERREREQGLSGRTSGAPRAVDWIYVTLDGDRRMYYFEASRRVSSVSPDVDQDTDPPGTVRVAVAGFLHEVQGQLLALGTKSELRWEQDGLPAGPSRPDLVPLGIVSHRGRLIWVMRGESAVNVWFTLYDVSPAGTRTLLTTRAHSC